MAEYKDKSKLTSILDLQEFLQDEFTDAGEALLSRAFTPITSGLGLESPQKPESQLIEKPFPFEPPAIAEKPKESSTLVEKQIQNFLDSDSLPPQKEKKIAEPVLMRTEIPEEKAPDILSVKSASEAAPKNLYSTLQSIPPPLPEKTPVPLFRRAAAIIIDQVFVLTLFSLALVLTSNAMAGFSVGFSTKIFRDFSNPLFIRFAVLEFVTLWLGYLAVCLFAMNTTFGMWIWGLKISFGDKNSENYSMRKLMRVVWSFIFCAPVITMLLLFIRKQGKNVIDILSGSSVCGSET